MAGTRGGCMFRHCEAPAAVALRFGDGTYRLGKNGMSRVYLQSFAVYCAEHATAVQEAFHCVHVMPVVRASVLAQGFDETAGR